MNENYKGSIELISGLKQKNDVDFPLMEAHAVAVYETDLEGQTTEIRLDEKLRRLKEESSVSEDTKKEIVSAAVDAVFVDETYTNLAEDVKENSTAIFAAETGLDYRVKQLETQIEEGDNKELNIKYEEKESMLYLYEGEELIKPNPDDESVVSNVISTTPISGGGGAGAALNYDLKLKILDTSSNLTFLHTDTPKINFIANFTDTTAEEGEDNLVAQSLNFKLTVSKNEGSSQTKIGTYAFVGMSNTNLDYDLTQILSNVNGLVVGDYSISLSASYTQEVGDEATPVTIQSTKKWLVKITQMYLESSFDDSGIKTGNVPLTVTVYGDLNKTIHYTFNGVKDWMKIENAALSNSDYSITIPKQSHGNYPLEVYLTAEVNGATITSDSLFYDIMFLDEGNSAPVIRAVPRVHKGQQYSTTIIDYSVYTPGELLSKVTLAVDGEVMSNLEGVDRSEKEWNYKPMDYGTKTLTITSGVTTRTIIFEVEKFPYEIAGVTAGLELDFLPQGRTNQDADYNIFHNNVFDEEGNEVPVTWNLSENFDWVNGGWKTDANGDSYFCVKAGTFVDINYLLFNDDNTLVGANKAKGNGKEFKIIFKTTNVARPDTTWLTCIAEPEIGDPLGLQMDAHTGYIRTSSGSSYLSVPYSEEDKIEFDFNIIPISYSETGEINFKTKDIPMVITYEDGTPVRPLVLDNDQITFKQATPVPITIGSPYCDVHIYRIKAYSTYLSEKNILNNFVADAPNAEEMIARYTRNQIYDAKTGKLTPESFAAACPHMRVLKISAPRFTNDKKDKVLETTAELIYKDGDPILDNWIAVNARHNGQGTSSNAYGYAGRNLELSLKEKETPRYKITKAEGVYNKDGDHLAYGDIVEGKQDFYDSDDEETRVKYEDPSTIAIVTIIPGTTITLGDGSTVDSEGKPIKKVSLTRDSVPTNYFNIKVNIASSEHANNALLQKRYDRYLPYTPYAKSRDEKIKNTMNFYNCVIFIQERNEDLTTHQEFNDNDWHFYSMGNIGDSKKTDDTRTSDPEDPNEFCVEIMDWNRELSAFPQDTKVPAFASKYVEKNNDGSVKKYVFATQENLENGVLFEKTGGHYEEVSKDESFGSSTYYFELVDGQYVLTKDDKNNSEKTYYKYVGGEYIVSEDEIINYEKPYYVDILEQDDFSEDFTYGWRYALDDEDPEILAACKAKWIEFYRFITKDLSYDDKRTDENGNVLEDPNKIAQWKKDLENWFVIDAAFYYYLFTLRYTMVDNRAKNSFWHYGKQGSKYKFDFWDYDNDTAFGIDNTGKFTMTYGVEDHDTNEGGAAHFRAHNSTFFVRIADYFADELITYWKDSLEQLDPQVFSSTSLINEFDAWQSEFPEEVWRLQYENIYKRTYVGGYGSEWDNRVNPAQIKKAADPQFLTEMMNGKKKYQRRQFERNQDVYMSSKFFGNTVFQDMMTLRGGGDMDANKFVVKPNGDITITPYLNMYVNTGVENNKFNHHVRINAGDSVTLKYPTSALEFNYIWGASYLQSLGDLSAMYLRVAKLGQGQRMKRLILGNPTEGYNNPNLENVEITSNNKLLEELDVRNMSKLGGNIPITYIPSLRKLYAQGTNYQTVQFANNGLIEEAYLPASINKIVANNLHYLHTLEIADYKNLQSLVIDSCPLIDEYAIVSAATNLKILRLTDIEWHLETTDLLNRLAKCTGIGEDGFTVVDQSVLTGYVYVDAIRQTERDLYASIWPKLEIHYGRIIQQWNLNFYNEGANILLDDPLYSYKVDTNTVLYPEIHDPVQNGMLTTLPSKPDSADGQYTYVFKDWDPSMEPTINTSGNEEYITVTRDMNFFASYEAQTRKYKVTWYGYNRTILQQSEVAYGDDGLYTGDIPTRTNQTDAYFLFGGWDSSSANITQDKDIEAIWLEANPGAPSTTDSTQLSPVEVYSLAQYTKDTSYNYSQFEKYIGTDSEITVQMGYMPTFENVESVVFTEAMKTYTGLRSEIVDTGIQLFNPNQSFTLAIDFTPHYQDTSVATKASNTIMACYDESSFLGFRLNNPGHSPVIQWHDQSALSLYPSGSNVTTTTETFREICVLRYEAQTKTLYFYSNNRFSLDDVYERTSSVNNLWSNFDATLTFGGLLNANTPQYATGEIHYAKLWYGDLGAEECKKICSWTYDTMRFEQVGTQRYNYSTVVDGASKNLATTASFLATELLEKPMPIYNNTISNSLYPGWYEADIRTWMNTKVFKGFSPEWQQILQSTIIYSLSNEEAPSTITNVDTPAKALQYYNRTSTMDKLYLPALAEIDPEPSEFSGSTEGINKYQDDKGPNKDNLSSYPQFTDTKESRIKKIKGTDEAAAWWTRTPNLNSPKYQRAVDPTGDYGTSGMYYQKEGDSTYYWFTPTEKKNCHVLLAFSI